MIRVVEGIKAFVEYTNNLVDREARLMAQANKELKEKLKPHDKFKLESVSI